MEDQGGEQSFLKLKMLSANQNKYGIKLLGLAKTTPLYLKLAPYKKILIEQLRCRARQSSPTQIQFARSHKPMQLVVKQLGSSYTYQYAKCTMPKHNQKFSRARLHKPNQRAQNTQLHKLSKVTNKATQVNQSHKRATSMLHKQRKKTSKLHKLTKNNSNYTSTIYE